MNLNQEPTIDQLRELFRVCDDDEGHHVLWVDKDGGVHLDVVPDELTPIGFEDSKPEMQCRYETYVAGNDYVGVDASNDDELMTRVFNSLINEWPNVRGSDDVEYIDMY